MSVKSKFSECPDFSCSRSDGTLEPVTSSFPAASESLRANSQSSAVVQPVRPLSRSFSPVRVQSGKKPVSQEKPVATVVTVDKNPLSQEKTRCHRKSPLSQVKYVIAREHILKRCFPKFQRIKLPAVFGIK